MFFLRRAHTVAIDEVQAAESASILARRRNHEIENHADFSQLEATLDIPSEQRSGVLRGLLDKLNDPAQTKLWQEHAAAHPERKTVSNFFGLALSGGGIRSATFNLGVLQVLAWTRMLRFVDYLSTVSGGGYIGSCVTSMFASPLREFPFDHKQGTREGTIFRHLRNNAEYLAPRGIIDYLVIPVTVLRGMVVNLLVILPYLLLAAILTAALHPSVGALQQHIINRATDDVPGVLGHSFIVTKCLLAFLLLAFVLYPMFHMFLQRTISERDSDWNLRSVVGRTYGALILLIAAVAFIEFQPVAIDWLVQKHSQNQWNLAAMSSGITALQALLPAVISAWLMKNSERLIAKYALALLGLSALAVFWVIYLWMCVVLIEGAYATAWSTMLVPGAIALGLMAYGAFFVDVNYTSVHTFYRDRLSKAYVVKQGKDEADLLPNDRQLLSKLNTEDGPYHIINTAINLRATKESYRRGRHAESFIFSKHFVGSEPTGYCKTTSMESQSRHLNLATAMAISGAAAAPNMGKETNRLLAFFLSMLNVRLDYWLPNPRYAINRDNENIPRSPIRRVGPLYLMREMLGHLTDTSRNINLSDGGHYDNLALYELFRRECRLIVCGDGEADASLQFNGLAAALRMAQIDFGIIVEMTGLDDLRSGKQNHAIGKIRYAGGRIGWLLYLKQSLNGDASLRVTLETIRYGGSTKPSDCNQYDAGAYIAEYKSRNPDFPHQSTGDQFFDEAQFECTRAVGYNVAYRTLCD
jgi:hypothetical protein